MSCTLNVAAEKILDIALIISCLFNCLKGLHVSRCGGSLSSTAYSSHHFPSEGGAMAQLIVWVIY